MHAIYNIKVSNKHLKWSDDATILYEVSCVCLHKSGVICILEMKEGHGDYDWSSQEANQ
jgi:hypothetical protein